MRWTTRAATMLAASLFAFPALGFDLFVSENKDVRNGNEKLAAGEDTAALARYDSAARALPGRLEVHLNRGLALLRLGDDRLDEATQALKIACESGAADAVRARALRNLGDAFFRKEDYKAAIEHYQRSLMTAPGNRDTAWNLEVARQRLKEQQEQQEQDQQEQDQQDQEQDQQEQDQQDQEQDQQDQDQDQQDQDQDQDQQDQDQDQQDQDQQDQDQEKKQDRQEQPEESPRTQQEMEQLLDSLDREEENLFKEQARQRARRVPAGVVKDW